MSTSELALRCQRCGTAMDMRDPAPGGPWKPDQFWVCPRCGRHFWTTYQNPPGSATTSPEPKPAAAAPPPKPAAASPAGAEPAGAPQADPKPGSPGS